MDDMTSKRRQGVIAAITTHAIRRPEVRDRLAAALESRDYEDRSDNDLFELATKLGVPDERLTAAGLLDAELYEVRDYKLCPTCRDTHWVRREDGRYVRCPTCNPEPTPEEEL